MGAVLLRAGTVRVEEAFARSQDKNHILNSVRAEA